MAQTPRWFAGDFLKAQFQRARVKRMSLQVDNRWVALKCVGVSLAI